MMKQERCISISSTSTEASAGEDENSYESLCQHNWERCEFCDRLFSNKYVLLKHNVSHIIIPLIKQTIHECEQCLHHFTSVEELATHVANKHETRTEYTKLEFEDRINGKIPEILQSIVNKQVYVKCEDELKEMFIKGSQLRQNGYRQDENDESHIVNSLHVMKPDTESFKTVSISSQSEPISLKSEPIIYKPDAVSDGCPSDEELESIRHRLLFEEDVEDNLFKDLTTDCHVNLEMMCTEITNLPNIRNYEKVEEVRTIDHNNSGVDVLKKGYQRDSTFEDRSYKVQEDPTPPLVKNSKAVHYDDLIENKVCRCRFCGQSFPNRFQLLQHEGKHLKLRQKQWRSPLCCICERYIAGNYHNLRRHMEKNHPDEVEQEMTYATYKCQKCTHQYHDYRKHLRHFHEYYKCAVCNAGFDSPKLLNIHECGKTNMAADVIKNVVTSKSCYQDLHETGVLGSSCRDSLEVKPDTMKSSYRDAIKFKPDTIKSSCRITSSVMQLCEMCFSFMKVYMQNRQNYELIGEKNELGVRQNCDKCNNMFFEVKLVKRKTKRMDTNIIKHRPLTNKDRLKKMQNRLKMMQKRNKF